VAIEDTVLLVVEFDWAEKGYIFGKEDIFAK
jgi:hypothetical protein